MASAVAGGAEPLGWSVRELPLSDGGEGLLDVMEVLGGACVHAEVVGPLGTPTRADILLTGSIAVIEMAQASGLTVAGGIDGNEPMKASSRGTGQLMTTAARLLRERRSEGARQRGGEAGRAGIEGPEGTLIVGLGGSATTDGGIGAAEAVEEEGGLGDVELIGACDVVTRFVGAAAAFGPQKGATPEQVTALERRLHEVADRYRTAFGIDVTEIDGGGAAGGMGGAIVALGGRLRSGYEVVADVLGLRQVLGSSDAVVTGEGLLDRGSFAGKAVGSLVGDATGAGLPVLVIAGRVTDEGRRLAENSGATVVSLVELFGAERAVAETERCIEESVRTALSTAAPFRHAVGGDAAGSAG